MDPLSRLDAMLSEFSPLFKHNNFNHFETLVKGMINTPYRGTLTQIYLSTEQSQTYWSLPKFLSRGVWCADEVASSLRRQVRIRNPKGLNRFVQLSFLTATLTQLAFRPLPAKQTNAENNTDAANIDLQTVLLTLNIHWYKPKYLTRGLMTAYLQRCLQQNHFSTSYDPGQNTMKILKIPEDAT